IAPRMEAVDRDRFQNVTEMIGAERAVVAAWLAAAALRASEVILAGFRGKTAGVALPDDPRMFQHIDPVGVWKRESHVLLAQQYGDRRGLAQFFQRLRQLFENDRR